MVWCCSASPPASASEASPRQRRPLQTGADCYHAAMILQHGGEPEDYLLDHELCVVAIGRGEERAKRLAATSEDRFLMTQLNRK